MAHLLSRSVPWLVACLAVFAVIAVVRISPGPDLDGTPPPDPTLDEEIAPTDFPAVLSLLTRLREEDGLDWRVISHLDTPWGPDVRLRPWYGGVEIRGVDVRVIADGRTVFEEPRYDGDRLRREAERLEGMIEDGSRSGQGATSTDASPPGQVSPWTVSPSGVLLVSGDAVSYAYEAVLSPITRLGGSPSGAGAEPGPLRGAGTDRTAGGESRNAGATSTSSALVAHLGVTVGSVEVDSEFPMADDTPLPIRVLLDPETGNPTRIQDLRRGADGEAHVFDPNPIAASGISGLRDGDPVDQYRVWLPLERLDAGGILRGKWVHVRSDLGPEANEPNRIYDYVSTDPRFEAAMAYVHGDRSFQHAEDLGFEGLFPTPIAIVVHGTRLDNSWYTPPTREIVFGSGGVDDAEDADIILHETGHAIHDALVPGFGGGNTRAISEGFADFWAASLTGDACVGDWDATSYGPPCLRRVDDDVSYPASLTGSVHKDGRIFSALLWDLREELGPAESERLALAAIREQSWDSTWEEAAEALLRASDLLGIRRSAVEPHLARRGFLSRILSVDLRDGDTARVPLPVTSSFLGRTALALDVSGNGSVRFVDTRDLDPASAPWFTPYAPEDTDGLTLRGRGEMNGATLIVDFSWLDSNERTVLRSRTEWDTQSGDITWCLLDVDLTRADARSAPLRFFSACGLGETVPAPIEWESGDIEVWPGLTGFQGEHPIELRSRVGERWELADHGNGAFDLRRSSFGRTLDSASEIFAQPSPFRRRTEIRLYVPSTRIVDVTVHSADGRRVRRLTREILERGLRIWEWDGTDDHGDDVPSGRYWVRAEGAGTDEVIPVVRIR